ncbi:MAG: DUF2807 domain-containing protein, partial [Flavobacteriaceae bacterium]|nr:DUF2807 domain-containing protein [Flavobacteriaceae bacterium]
MKKVLLKSIAALFVSILFLTSCNAQKYGRIKGSGNIINETRNVGSFEKVAVSGSFDVFLVKGNEGKLDIKIEDNLLAYLVTEVDNGKLKIKWKKGTSINTRKAVIITVYFKDIEAVSLSGSGDIIGKDLIKSNNFEVAVAGSGDIKLDVETNEMDAAISGSGDIDLEGSSENFTAAIAGSGDIDAVNLKTDKATLRISGSGGITITVINELIAKISGSGDIKYKGNPKIEDIKVSGS